MLDPIKLAEKDKSEWGQQTALFAWAALNAERWPALKLLYAIPNGGFRNKIEASRLKISGTRAGVPDVHLAYPEGPYVGLWIELKIKGNKTSPEQDKWIARLRDAGHCVKVCYGFYEARDAVLGYLLQLPLENER